MARQNMAIHLSHKYMYHPWVQIYIWLFKEYEEIKKKMCKELQEASN
jgi:hypothetical protein